MRTTLVIAAGATLLALASCSSSGGKQAKVTAAPKASVTTTTESNAIGLHTNADEEAELQPDKPLTAAQRQALAVQLVAARSAAEQYPTVADAVKAGLVQAGLFTPGAGAHYVSVAGAVGGVSGPAAVDSSRPEAWIYDGISPTSRVVGLMYASFSNNPPAGFSGPNDHWHRHTNLCITYGSGKIQIPFAPDSNVTKSQCDAKHGQFMRRTFWMVHAWVVPAWDSPQGVFSHANIDLHCGDGTDNVDAVGFCKGT
jgi:hypothetical protein